jgi:hypothetical protein
MSTIWRAFGEVGVDVAESEVCCCAGVFGIVAGAPHPMHWPKDPCQGWNHLRAGGVDDGDVATISGGS